MVVGATYFPEISVKPAGEPAEQFDMPGFNRRLIMPGQFGVGVGWMPNRFFKAGFSLSYVAPTKNTALLADQSVTTGARRTFVPRLGLSYVLAEYKNFKMEGAGGTYYEMSRLSQYPGRLHGTVGLEINPYFFNLGAGADLASDYKNVMVSVGIDIVRTLRTFDLIPKDPIPTYDGFFPKPQKVSADGLPAGLTQGEEQHFKAPDVDDVGKIISDFPRRVAEKVSGNQPPPIRAKLEIRERGNALSSGKAKEQ